MAVVTPLTNQSPQSVARREYTHHHDVQPRAAVVDTATSSDLERLQASVRGDVLEVETKLQQQVQDLQLEVQDLKVELSARLKVELSAHLKVELSAQIHELRDELKVQPSPSFGLWAVLATGFVVSSMIAIHGIRLTMDQK